ncbi:DUF1992 domain-containing protein [Microbacterium deminutum]|uniref:DnaJ homologue subfamily C member 28 conserved domain-containing protein n=1 Tax=Microbacterium deminutum TaxID=344164 RepID=A0ABN2QYM4_9MICO
MTEDPRVAAARYRVEQLARDAADPADAQGPEAAEPSPPKEQPRSSTAAQRAAFVEVSIQQAIRRGEFDNLPGAGKPLPGLGTHHDPDWWIKRKIETEKLTGLGPPALTLRVESAELPARLDQLGHEEDVRAALEDFNRRVIEARRQLLGGPPVVTPTRDVEAEVRSWRERRAERMSQTAAPPDDRVRRRWSIWPRRAGA